MRIVGTAAPEVEAGDCGTNKGQALFREEEKHRARRDDGEVDPGELNGVDFGLQDRVHSHECQKLARIDFVHEGDIVRGTLRTEQIDVNKTLNNADGEEGKGVEKQDIRISQLQRDSRQSTVDE